MVVTLRRQCASLPPEQRRLYARASIGVAVFPLHAVGGARAGKALQRSPERWRSDPQNRSRARMLLPTRAPRARAMAENHLSNAAHTTEANEHTRLAHSPRSISEHSAAGGSTRDGHKTRSAVGPPQRKETTKQGRRRHSLRQAQLGYRSSLLHLFLAGPMKPLLLLPWRAQHGHFESTDTPQHGRRAWRNKHATRRFVQRFCAQSTNVTSETHYVVRDMSNLVPPAVATTPCPGGVPVNSDCGDTRGIRPPGAHALDSMFLP